MANFWDIIDEETYENGFDRWMVRSRTSPEIVRLTDERYEALQVKTAKSAYYNMDTGLTRAENYYLIAENIGAFEANQYLKRGA